MFGFTYQDAAYYYVKNLQGDIIGILNQAGEQITRYDYNAWGSPDMYDGQDFGEVGEANPLRYRSYYFDTETYLYYLNSRYYHPEYHRFISADSVLGVNKDILSYNLFAYCSNNPVIFSDPTGTYKTNNWLEAFLLALAEVLSDPQIQIRILLEVGEVHFSNGLRICTDGAKKGVIPDSNWQRQTAYGNYNKGIYLDALSVNYIVLPGNYSGDAKLGDLGAVIDKKTGNVIWCIVGEVGPKGAGFGEVSIAAVWDLGYSDHRTANVGIDGDFEIIVFPGTKVHLDWSKSIQPQINSYGW